MLKILRFFIRPLIQAEGKSFWTAIPGRRQGPVFDISDILDTGDGAVRSCLKAGTHNDGSFVHQEKRKPTGSGRSGAGNRR